MSDGRPDAAAGLASRPRPRPVRAVLVDLDNTLIDTDAAMATAMRAAVAKVAGDPSEEVLAEVSAAWLADRHGWMKRYQAGELGWVEQRRHRYVEVAALAGVGVETFDAWQQLYMAELVAATKGFDDAVEFLRAVEGVPVAVVTNVGTDIQLAKIHAAGLARWLPLVIGVDLGGAPKPDPAPFLMACGLLRCEPSEAVHVGDSWSSDVMGAVGLGMRAVWLDRARAGDARELPDGVRRVGGLAEIIPMLDASYRW